MSWGKLGKVSLIILYIFYVAKTQQRLDGMYGVSGSRRCRGRRRRRCWSHVTMLISSNTDPVCNAYINWQHLNKLFVRKYGFNQFFMKETSLMRCFFSRRVLSYESSYNSISKQTICCLFIPHAYANIDTHVFYQFLTFSVKCN